MLLALDCLLGSKSAGEALFLGLFWRLWRRRWRLFRLISKLGAYPSAGIFLVEELEFWLAVHTFPIQKPKYQN